MPCIMVLHFFFISASHAPPTLSRRFASPTLTLALQTPAAAQWWHFKSSNMDTVLFFRQGKFYELFHMDADVCVKELGLTYMKGEE